ncbi:hypothetical protein GCM10020220_068730 [Nonomuraea rubra]
MKITGVELRRIAMSLVAFRTSFDTVTTHDVLLVRVVTSTPRDGLSPRWKARSPITSAHDQHDAAGKNSGNSRTDYLVTDVGPAEVRAPRRPARDVPALSSDSGSGFANVGGLARRPVRLER